MAYTDLQSFIAALESAGQLRRVRVPVDPELEITEIADRMSKSASPEGITRAPATDPVHGGLGGRALLFERVRGSDIPLAINLFGSYERMRMALGCESFEALAAHVQKLAKPEPPTTLIEKMKMLPELAKIAGYAPKSVKRGMCQEVVHIDDADLYSLPIIKCWPHDAGTDDKVMVGRKSGSNAMSRGVGSSDMPIAFTSGPMAGAAGAPGAMPTATAWSPGRPSACPQGRYITFAGIYTNNPDGTHRNIGMYRIQVTGPKSAIFHCHVHHDGARHQRMWAAQGRDMPIAIVLGGESVLPYAATCPFLRP